jgi:glycosyltransferase 2 family protein
MKRPLRVSLTLLVTGLCLAYLIWKIDLGKTLRVIADANPWYLLLALALMIVTILPMAWRWQLLLRAKGVDENIPWLTRAYFVSYAAGQILPTSVGGDAVRIYETARRHPGQGDTAAATVLLERAIGGAATLLLAAIGFLLAVGHYDVGAYLWIEAFFVVATIILGFLLFSRRARPLLKLGRPVLAWVRLDKLVARVYHAMHSYRDHVGVLFTVFFVTLGVQAIRVLAVWLSGKAVGIDLSPRPYYVMGPLLFLVMLVPFTINGFAVRESFFVSFLGKVGVSPDQAFAAGFLFFLLTILMAVPGALILAWEGLRGSKREPRIAREADG